MTRRKIRDTIVVAAIVVAIAGAAFWELQARKPHPHATIAVTAPETIESSGEVLGVSIGSQMSEAHARLDPLRAPGDHSPDQKEKAGKRAYWKLNGTDYDWIIVWANSKGEVTRLRVACRAETPKPFAEIGDLSRAAVNTPEKAMWNVTAPGKPAYRLIAQGKDHLATTFYMFALNLEMR